MTDPVNDYFKQFYPPQSVLDATDPEYGSVGRCYSIPGYSNIFPAMVMADGLVLSVQGHHGAYSYPRDDFADEYTRVEIMGPRKADDLLAPFERDHNAVGDQMIYPGVPVSIVAAIIEKHGGLAPPLSARPTPSCDGRAEALEWQPIETAPKDGTKIDLWVHFAEGDEGSRIPDAWWDEKHSAWNFGPGRFRSDQYMYPVTPTHWQPLPEPPIRALTQKDKADG